jgi:transcriptional regulator with XRE-family HTH domain
MEYRNKVRCCLEFVKEHVKKSSIGYQQLAERLGVSILTIKRQLNGHEISMSKLLALCDAAQVDFSEIWAKVEKQYIMYLLKSRITHFTIFLIYLDILLSC